MTNIQVKTRAKLPETVFVIMVVPDSDILGAPIMCEYKYFADLEACFKHLAYSVLEPARKNKPIYVCVGAIQVAKKVDDMLALLNGRPDKLGTVVTIWEAYPNVECKRVPIEWAFPGDGAWISNHPLSVCMEE